MNTKSIYIQVRNRSSLGKKYGLDFNKTIDIWPMTFDKQKMYSHLLSVKGIKEAQRKIEREMFIFLNRLNVFWRK